MLLPRSYSRTCTSITKSGDETAPYLRRQDSELPELERLPEWTTETYAWQEHFTTLHQPLEKIHGAMSPAPRQQFPLNSDLQERGSEMVGTKKSSRVKFTIILALF